MGRVIPTVDRPCRDSTGYSIDMVSALRMSMSDPWCFALKLSFESRTSCGGERWRKRTCFALLCLRLSQEPAVSESSIQDGILLGLPDDDDILITFLMLLLMLLLLKMRNDSALDDMYCSVPQVVCLKLR